jgi:lactoylglutathione lyase
VRAFPVIYARDVRAMSQFYVRLGFEVVYQFPPEGDAGYVSMQRGDSSLGITTVDSPKMLARIEVGTEPRFEMFVYVEDVDATVDELNRTGVHVLSDPQDMPWGERVAYVSDPEGNPVSLAQGDG